MTLSYVPIWLVDMVGSFMMIVLSLLCLRLVFRLRRRDQDNIIWT